MKVTLFPPNIDAKVNSYFEPYAPENFIPIYTILIKTWLVKQIEFLLLPFVFIFFLFIQALTLLGPHCKSNGRSFLNISN